MQKQPGFLVILEHEYLKNTSILEDTWLILTSDHGERFERGSLKHFYYLMHNPVIQIPLVIFPPGQKDRVDNYSRTSAIDILSTLLHVTGQNILDGVKANCFRPFKPLRTILSEVSLR